MVFESWALIASRETHVSANSASDYEKRDWTPSKRSGRPTCALLAAADERPLEGEAAQLVYVRFLLSLRNVNDPIPAQNGRPPPNGRDAMDWFELTFASEALRQSEGRIRSLGMQTPRHFTLGNNGGGIRSDTWQFTI